MANENINVRELFGPNVFARSIITQRSPPASPNEILESQETDIEEVFATPSDRVEKEKSKDKKKRKIAEVTSDEDCPLWQQYDHEFDSHLNILKSHIANQHKNSKLSVSLFNKLNASIADVRTCVKKMQIAYERENAILGTKLKVLEEQPNQSVQDITQSVVSALQNVILPQAITPTTPQVPSYANITVNKSLKVPIRPKPNIVLFYPAGKPAEGNSEDTKKKVVSVIKPREQGIQLKQIRTISRGGVLLEAANEESLKTIVNSEPIKNLGLVAEDPKRLLPKIVIRNIDPDLDSGVILDCIYSQNLKDSYSKEFFADNFSLLFKTGPKDGLTTSWVAECSPELRKIFWDSGRRIYIDFSSCPVYDFTNVTRCFKCQGFNHVASKCQRKTPTCGHCGEDHSYQDCTKRNFPPTCSNCKRINKPHDHSVRSNDCPYYIRIKQEAIKRIDYGS